MTIESMPHWAGRAIGQCLGKASKDAQLARTFTLVCSGQAMGSRQANADREENRFWPERNKTRSKNIDFWSGRQLKKIKKQNMMADFAGSAGNSYLFGIRIIMLT